MTDVKQTKLGDVIVRRCQWFDDKRAAHL